MAGSLIVAWAMLVFAALVAHGYGVATIYLCRNVPVGWAPTSAIGLAALMLLGGLANLLQLAFAPLLLALAAIGAALDLWWWLGGGLRRQRHALRDYGLGPALFVAAIVVAVLSFVAVTQFPPAAVNLHDDLEKYFAFPTRMLATGTLAGSPLNALGIETLGGQAWFHGFLLAVLPIQYVNGFDALICLGLAMLLLAGLVRARQVPVGALAIVVLVTIDPQYVNVSPLYFGVALSLALVLRRFERPARPGEDVVTGLMLAALVAAKPSLVPFAVVALLGDAATTMALRGGVAQAIASLARTAIWSALFVAPWLGLYAAQYVHWTALPASAGPAPSVPLAAFFSLADLPYGAAAAIYTGATVLGLAVAVFGGIAGRGDGKRPALALAATALAGTVSYFAETWFLASYQSSFGTAFRYGLLNVLIVAPLCVALGWREQGRWAGPSRAAALLLAGGVVAGFAPSLLGRIDQAWTYGHVLAFGWSATQGEYFDYNRARLGKDAGDGARGAQKLVPPGEPILVWTESPFQFDFARNPILDVQPAGLATPWARVPTVRYLIWEYRGFAVRTPQAYEDAAEGVGLYERIIALRSLAFVRALDAATRSGRILYNDGWLVVVALAGPIDQGWRKVRP